MRQSRPWWQIPLHRAKQAITELQLTQVFVTGGPETPPVNGALHIRSQNGKARDSLRISQQIINIKLDELVFHLKAFAKEN
jgi:hypothetical protein